MTMNWTKTTAGYVSECGTFTIVRRKGGDFDVFLKDRDDRINARCCSLKDAKLLANDQYQFTPLPIEMTSAPAPEPVVMPAAEARTRYTGTFIKIIDANAFSYSKGQTRKYRKVLHKLGLSFPKQGEFVVLNRKDDVLDPHDLAISQLAAYVVTKNGTTLPVKLAG